MNNIDKDIFFDLNKILSYNAMLNFISGERGCGKTYSCAKFVINQFLKKNEEFAYIRRYKTDLSTSVPTFFEAINKNNEFPDHTLTAHSNTFFCDKTVCGHAMKLSTAQDLKSSNFSNVKTIIFDEYGIEEGQKKYYLKNEVFTFLNLVETIARLRDIRVFLLSNAVSRTNPYFLYFDLDVPYNSDIKLYKDGLILVNHTKNLKYRETKKATKFGRLVNNTSYSDYAIDNKFLNDSSTFIMKKQGSAKFSFAFIAHNQTFGVWFDNKLDLMFVSNDFIQNTPFLFSTSLDNHSTNTIFLQAKKKYKVWRMFIEYFNLGKLRFENVKIKNLCDNLIKSLIC